MKGILLEIRQTGSTELSDLDLENIDAIENKLRILPKKINEVIKLKTKLLLLYIFFGSERSLRGADVVGGWVCESVGQHYALKLI